MLCHVLSCLRLPHSLCPPVFYEQPPNLTSTPLGVKGAQLLARGGRRARAPLHNTSVLLSSPPPPYSLSPHSSRLRAYSSHQRVRAGYLPVLLHIPQERPSLLLVAELRRALPQTLVAGRIFAISEVICLFVSPFVDSSGQVVTLLRVGGV